MGEIIVPNAVKRKEGYIYYIDGEGNLCETKRSTGKKKGVVGKKKKAAIKKATKVTKK